MSRRKNNYIFAPEQHRRKGPGCLVLFLAVVLAVLVLSLMGNAAMNRRLELVTAKIPVMALDKSYEKFTVLQISDLHAAEVGSDAPAWRTALYGKSYAAVILTGDMVGKSGNFAPLVSLIETLRGINEAVPIYFVAGDDDPPPVVSVYRGTPEVYADWVIAAREAGAVYLDAPISQKVGKNFCWFVPEYLYSIDVTGMLQSLTYQKEEMEAKGMPYEAEGGASYRALLCRLEAMQRTVDAVKSMTSKDLQIAVSHVPLSVEYVRTAVEWAQPETIFSIRRVSLVLAGHYVAGQWRLFGLGPVYVPDIGWFPGDEGILGLQRINSVSQYIGGGVGASSFYPMPGRLFNTPSMAMLSFTAKIE